MTLSHVIKVDEDITPSDVPTDPPTIMQGPMTWARKRQLNLEVSSFLSDTFHTFENRLLPNDVILLRNIGEGHERLRGSGGGDDDQQGRPTKPEAQSNMNSSLPRPLGPVCLKLVTQDVSGLCFRQSTYGWKDNLTRKPIQLVSHQKPFRINRNHQNKSASRICQGAATPSFGPLDRVSSLGLLGGVTRVGDDPKNFIIIRHHHH